MLKNLSRLEHVIGNKVYHLVCDHDSPLVEIKEALNQFMAFVINVEKNVAAAQAVKEEEKVAVPDEKIVEMPKE